MADPQGFLRVRERELPARRPVPVRIRDWKEVYEEQELGQLQRQAGRCMDCGIPFCHSGCPLGNLIPEWNNLAWRGDWTDAIERLHATNNFPEFTGRLCPAPCETACVLGINQPAVTIKQVEVTTIEQAFDERARAAAAAGAPLGQDRRRRRVRPGRPGRGPAADARRPHGRRLRAGRQARRTAALRHPGVQDGEVGARPAPRPDDGRGHPLPQRHERRRRHHRTPAARPLRRRRARPRGHRAARPRRSRAGSSGASTRRWTTSRRATAPPSASRSRTRSSPPTSTSSSSAAVTPAPTASAPRTARARRR